MVSFGVTVSCMPLAEVDCDDEYKPNMPVFLFFHSVASKTKFFENASKHVGRYVKIFCFLSAPD